MDCRGTIAKSSRGDWRIWSDVVGHLLSSNTQMWHHRRPRAPTSALSPSLGSLRSTATPGRSDICRQSRSLQTSICRCPLPHGLRQYLRLQHYPPIRHVFQRHSTWSTNIKAPRTTRLTRTPPMSTSIARTTAGHSPPHSLSCSRPGAQQSKRRRLARTT